MLRYGLQEMDGKKLYLLRREALRPGVEFVEKRYGVFRAAV